MFAHGPTPDRSEPQNTPSTASDRPRIVNAAELLQGANEILISHGDDTYRLRQTRNGKLILHK